MTQILIVEDEMSIADTLVFALGGEGFATHWVRLGREAIEHVESGVRSFGHGGNAPGMDADLRIFPASGYVVAVLANVDPPSAQRVSEFISNRVPAR